MHLQLKGEMACGVLNFSPVAAEQDGGLQCQQAAQRVHHASHVLVEASNLQQGVTAARRCCTVLLAAVIGAVLQRICYSACVAVRVLLHLGAFADESIGGEQPGTGGNLKASVRGECSVCV